MTAEKKYYLGFDIGGTKCAAALGEAVGSDIHIIDKSFFQTKKERGWQAVVAELCAAADALLAANGSPVLTRIGLSCGGPLDSVKGVVQCPPNLPDWDEVPIVDILKSHFGVETRLQNDANACAVAEWKFGAGRGLDNMIFLTFGTGMGAGLILGGRLYSGSCDLAGEVGHMRLTDDGPEGYGKHGSFEGYCSGGGIARLAQARALEALNSGRPFAWCKNESELESISAKSVSVFADNGDGDAKEIYSICGEHLGRGLAVLIDLLNPQAIVIGSIFTRSRELLEPAMNSVLKRECLAMSLEKCRILPAALGESIGDYAALGVALM